MTFIIDAEAQRTQRAISNEKVRFLFYFFCYKNKKKHEENAKFGINTTLSAFADFSPMRLCVRIF